MSDHLKELSQRHLLYPDLWRWRWVLVAVQKDALDEYPSHGRRRAEDPEDEFGVKGLGPHFHR